MVNPALTRDCAEQHTGLHEYMGAEGMMRPGACPRCQESLEHVSEVLDGWAIVLHQYKYWGSLEHCGY